METQGKEEIEKTAFWAIKEAQRTNLISWTFHGSRTEVE